MFKGKIEIYKETILWRIEPILRPYEKILPDNIADRIAEAVSELVEDAIEGSNHV